MKLLHSLECIAATEYNIISFSYLIKIIFLFYHFSIFSTTIKNVASISALTVKNNLKFRGRTL
ncbi:hypothetical protein AGMMS49573_08790 [Endomicrobiia bacterium]|nr:hypothetical protein AGMMS49532_09560 [Endomicrobiia bacterium]GHT17255.1 hypothetical protein AGMMS49573_08790 [Endomicrobiia bacterium]